MRSPFCTLLYTDIAVRKICHTNYISPSTRVRRSPSRCAWWMKTTTLWSACACPYASWEGEVWTDVRGLTTCCEKRTLLNVYKDIKIITVIKLYITTSFFYIDIINIHLLTRIIFLKSRYTVFEFTVKELYHLAFQKRIFFLEIYMWPSLKVSN